MTGFTITGGVQFSIGLSTYFTPIYLFIQGEQGVWYDPSDITTLFQDSAGTIPVTSIDQPVGLIADKSSNNNDAIQSNVSLRPSYDEWDEVNYIRFAPTQNLSVTFPGNLGSNCTIGIALINTDPVIIPSQVIGTSFTISDDNAGIVIVNRGLTEIETGLLFNFLKEKGELEYSILGQYLNITDSNATPSNTFFTANSVNNGNNTGWTFL